jgi:hypothetical protein
MGVSTSVRYLSACYLANIAQVVAKIDFFWFFHTIAA